MKKYSILIAMVLYTLSLSGQKNQTELYRLESAKRQIKTGTILTLSGIGTTAVGTVLFITGSGKKDPPVPGRINSDTYTSVSGVVGLGLMLAGPVLVIIGVPNIISGNYRKERARSSLSMTIVTFKSYEASTLVPGIGLSYRF